jgi:hypothetical protein
VRQQALRPFVKEIIGGHRVTPRRSDQTQLFAEPLQCLITIGCDRCRHNLVPVYLVEAVPHKDKPLVWGPIV